MIRLNSILLGQITRLLRTVRNLYGKVYVVGGLITEGETARDIDIVVSNPKDIAQLKKALGKYAERAHFLIQKKEPLATEFLKVTGKEPKNADYEQPIRGKRISKNEYAGTI